MASRNKGGRGLPEELQPDFLEGATIEELVAIYLDHHAGEALKNLALKQISTISHTFGNWCKVHALLLAHEGGNETLLFQMTEEKMADLVADVN